MSNEVEAELIDPAAVAAATPASDPNTIVLPCGCWRGVRKRMVPDFDPENGTPRLDAAGAFLMREQEDIEEGYCADHAADLNDRTQHVMKALAEGASPDEAIAMLEGRTDPIKQLVEHLNEAATAALPEDEWTK